MKSGAKGMMVITMNVYKNFKRYDIIIIGGGPGGLFTAYELVNRGFDGDILILEQGKKVEDREKSMSSSSIVFEDIIDLVHGIGGAGLFLDSKLCLDTVGTKIEASKDIINYVDNVFLNLIGNRFKSKIPNVDKLKDKKELVRNTKLEFYTYPIRFLGTDGGREFIRKMYSYLIKKGVEIETSHKVIEVKKNNSFNVTAISLKDGKIKQCISNYLVVGVGASGFRWVQRKLHPLGLSGVQNPTYIGIRLEFAEDVGRDIYELSDNPKIKLFQDDFCVKTHCFCYKGYVISYKTPRGVLVDGHAYSTRNGTNNNMNILFKIDTTFIKDPVTFSWDIISICNKVGSGKSILQRYENFKKGNFTNKIGNIKPSLNSYSLSNINMAYPRSICKMLVEFVERLDKIFPGIADNDNLVYAPTLQWGMSRIHTNYNMESIACQNLYIIGDCAGITQGIIAAATTGILAARDIIKKYNKGG